MNGSMSNLFGLNEYIGINSYLEMALFIIIIAVIAGTFGFFSNYLMKEHGFGVIGNGILIVIGSGIGLYARATFGQYQDIPGVNLTIMYVVGISTLFLFVFGVVKSWLVD